jgi:hypothetical protein
MNQIISNTTLLLAAVSAMWIIWLFLTKRQGEPGGELQIHVDFVGQQNDNWLIEVSAILTNRSLVRHRYGAFRLKVRYLLPDDIIKDGVKKLNYQLYFPRTIDEGANRINKKPRFFANAEYIDPGLSFRHSYITFVPAKATFVWVQCELLFPSWYQLLRWRKLQDKLKNKEVLLPEDKQKLRLKNAQKLFKVPKADES